MAKKVGGRRLQRRRVIRGNVVPGVGAAVRALFAQRPVSGYGGAGMPRIPRATTLAGLVAPVQSAIDSMKTRKRGRR